MSMGVFAVSYAATWTTSQDDQATFQVGADVRVPPSRRGDALPVYGPRTGIRGARRESPRRARSSAGRRTACRRGAARAGRRARRRGGPGRGHDAARPVGRGAGGRPVRATRGGRPDGRGGRVSRASRDRCASRSISTPHGRAIRVRRADEDVRLVPVDPASIADWPGITVSAVVRDARGMLHRFAGQRSRWTGGPHEIGRPARHRSRPRGVVRLSARSRRARARRQPPGRYLMSHDRVTVAVSRVEAGRAATAPWPPVST